MPVPESSAVASPCVKVCRLNASQTCLGCGRTLHEIACWSSCDQAAKTAIVVMADQRLQVLQGLDSLPHARAAVSV